jgi:hypothetical protein
MPSADSPAPVMHPSWMSTTWWPSVCRSIYTWKLETCLCGSVGLEYGHESHDLVR